MSTDLIAALRAALHADEAAALAATPGPWHRDSYRVDGGETDDVQAIADAAHIARHDPAAVLRRIAADRKQLELHRPVQRRTAGSGRGVIEGCAICGHFPAQYPCATLRLLAEAYGIRA